MATSTLTVPTCYIGRDAYIIINRTNSSYTHTLSYTVGSSIGNIVTKTPATSVKWAVPTSFYNILPTTAKTMSGTITCYTYNGSTLIGSTITNITISAVEKDCLPDIDASAYDSNAITVALTGDNTKFVKDASIAYVGFNATAKNRATISSQSCSNGDITLENSTGNGTINPVIVSTFIYKATDSRGFTSYQYITRELVDYFKQTCDLEVSAPTTSGKADLTISGNWFDGSFGAVANVLQLQYCYKENNSDYGDWITVIPGSSTYNKYEYSTTLTGLNYKSKYTFKARAIDKINTVISELQVRRTEPIFDWGVDSNGNADFNINGALKINGNSIDYIVEEGTKGIWTYRKWNSGIAECWGTTSPKTLTLNTAWGNLYTNNTSLINNAISYPFSFTATPAVVASTIFNNTSYWAVMANSGGVSSSPEYKAVMPQSGSATCSLHFHVIGKWK